MFAVHQEESALDIVQDAMLKLAEKYGDRPEEEFPMLFQRILQNTIRDFYRRSKVRSMWTTLLSAFSSDEDDAGPKTPESKLQQAQTLNIIDGEIRKLPARQREAFLMRYWEDMDVAETAAAMGCSEGSVKTHCSRATHALAAALSAKGVKL
jgi:RNA polymerase sigma-70 factor, ECF subfamily